MTEQEQQLAEVTDLVERLQAPLPVDDTDTDGTAEQVVLTKTGWLRATLPDGATIRLRRPFMGELKRFRLAMEDMEDQLSDASEASNVAGAELTDTLEATLADPASTSLAKARATAETRRQSRKIARELTKLGDDLRIGWWRQVVGVLSVDGTQLPEDEDLLPAWMVDGVFPHRVLSHWRQVPLARG